MHCWKCWENVVRSPKKSYFFSQNEKMSVCSKITSFQTFFSFLGEFGRINLKKIGGSIFLNMKQEGSNLFEHKSGGHSMHIRCFWLIITHTQHTPKYTHKTDTNHGPISRGTYFSKQMERPLKFINRQKLYPLKREVPFLLIIRTM